MPRNPLRSATSEPTDAPLFAYLDAKDRERVNQAIRFFLGWADNKTPRGDAQGRQLAGPVAQQLVEVRCDYGIMQLAAPPTAYSGEFADSERCSPKGRSFRFFWRTPAELVNYRPGIAT
jgi:hypothetical protein